jgi:CPA2 family monovalent cation:H+ antiporter-2
VTDTVLFQAFVYLCAAVVCVPIAKRLGLGAVLGYLVAGVLVGPNVLGAIGGEGADVMHFAEFGVVMMLFVVGLELQPALLWRMRRRSSGSAGCRSRRPPRWWRPARWRSACRGAAALAIG